MRYRIIALSAVVVLCCASTTRAQETPPDFKTIIRTNLEHFDIFAEQRAAENGSYPTEIQIISSTSLVTDVAISDIARKVQTNLFGIAWQTCVKATVERKPRTIAVFVSERHVVDSRTALGIDQCDSGNYVPLPIKRVYRHK